MKQKLIIKETGKPVEIGDIIEIHYHHIKNDGTEITGVLKNTLTEENIPKLIKKGIIAVQTFGQPTNYEGVPTDIQYYYEKLTKSITSTPIEALFIGASLNTIVEYYPSVIFQLLARQIAIELDHRYNDDISKSEKIYAICITDGKVFEVNKSTIKNFRNFAAFRTEEDANFARKILSCFTKILYGGKQKD